MKLFQKSNPYDETDVAGPQGSVGSAEELVPVQGLHDNMMVLKDGSFRMIVQSSSVNFDLKSGREQNILLNTFGELLNSLSVDFPIQILLHAAHLDTSRYINRYRDRLSEPGLSPQLREVIEEHIEYFEYQARASYLLDRSFYIVVPFFGADHRHQLADGGISGEMIGGGFLRSIMDGSDKEKTREASPKEIEIARVQLLNRASLIIAQLARLNITGNVLGQLELVQLLRELYNPGISERQKVRELGDVGSLIALPTGAPPRARNRIIGDGN